MTDKSINNLIGTFDSFNITTYTAQQNNLICIDTSENRLGINTLDPEEAIHVSGGTIKTTNLDISGVLTGTIDMSNATIPTFIIPNNSSNVTKNQLYIDPSGFLKIKLTV